MAEVNLNQMQTDSETEASRDFYLLSSGKNVNSLSLTITDNNYHLYVLLYKTVQMK